ncbi:MAG TPA: zinc metallopeptidase [Mollicutes bacterium]|jgi:Zn-dependent membrane protease YugP|nr:zinc metallopeptidase [Mollicutes bacterium]
MEHLVYILLILAIPLVAQIFVTSSYKRYHDIENGKNITGYDVARKILDDNDLKQMYIVSTNGTMSDHYDSARKTVRLSKDVYNGTSIASLAIAAHECGHAIQDKEGYFFMRMRSFIFPFINLGTKLAYGILILSILFQLADLLWVSIVLVALGLIFQLVTLPVEFNASTRAKAEIEKLKLANTTELTGVDKMLKAAAYTYVAGVLASALELVRLLAILNDRN